ncbi:MAG TPA: photosystem I reaction center subunit IV, partial [Prochlorococcus sp.]
MAVSKGDKVRVKRQESYWFNEVGSVVSVEATNKYGVMVRFEKTNYFGIQG